MVPIDPASLAEQPAPEAVRRAAAEVMAQSKYHYDRQGVDVSWILELIQNWLRLIFTPVEKALEALGIVSPVLAWGIVALLLLVVAALVAHIIYTFVTALRGTRLAPLRRDDAAQRALRTPEQWEAEARACAARGNFLEAVRCLLRGGLMRLSAARRKPFPPGATNRECLRLSRQSPAHAPLGEMIEIVDARWYGGQLCSADDFDRCQMAHARILDQLDSAPHA